MKKISMLGKIRRILSSLDPGMLFFLFLVLILTVIWMGVNLPMTSVSAQATPPTPTPAAPGAPQATPIPAEYLATDAQTDGIVFGSVVLVLIVVGGTLSVMLRKNDGKPPK